MLVDKCLNLIEDRITEIKAMLQEIGSDQASDVLRKLEILESVVGELRNEKTESAG